MITNSDFCTMSLSKCWYFKINDNDDANKIVRGFCTLDLIVSVTNKIKQLCYGFMRKNGQGIRFGIEGYIYFVKEEDKVNVSLALPEFEVKIFNYNNYCTEFQDYLARHSIFTKYSRGTENDEGKPETLFDEEWFYMELHAPNES